MIKDKINKFSHLKQTIQWSADNYFKILITEFNTYYFVF